MSLPAAVILVQVAPPESAREHGELLTTACTQGLRRGACVLIGAATPDPRAVVAEVIWQGDFRVATVRVGTPGTAREQWASGTVAFDEQDALEARWTTAGFTIATLAGDLVFQKPVRPPVAPAALPRPQKNSIPTPQAVARPQPQERRPFEISLGGSLGQAMSDQGFSAGPWLSVAYSPLPLPAALRLRASTTFAESAQTSVSWTNLTGGVELSQPLGDSGLSLVGAVEGGASLISASAESQASRLTGVICLLLGLELSLGGPFRAILAADVSFAPATHLRQPDGKTSTDRRAKASGLAGLQVEL